MKKLLILATMLSFGAFAQTSDVGDQKSATIEAFVNVDSALTLSDESPMDFGTLIAGESTVSRYADQLGSFNINKDADRTVSIEMPHSITLKEQDENGDKANGAQIMVHDVEFTATGNISGEAFYGNGYTLSEENPSASGVGLDEELVEVVIDGSIQSSDATVAGSYKGSFEALVQYE